MCMRDIFVSAHVVGTVDAPQVRRTKSITVYEQGPYFSAVPSLELG